MAHTVSLLADHKGFTKPKAVGDEYMVDAIVNITNYVQGGITLTAASVGLSQITQLIVTGVEEIGQSARAVVSNTGAYESIDSVKIMNCLNGNKNLIMVHSNYYIKLFSFKPFICIFSIC